uniref:Uncharacterized protein n=1 Tax=Panagrolaimus sp. PS1159 TaxID=55785 RepID=A0AC35GV42_9BILA
LARFPCDTQNMAMTVEIRSKYFEVPADDIRKDVERNLDVEDVTDSESNDSPPTSGRSSEKPDDHNSANDIEVVKSSPSQSDIPETPRHNPNHSSDNVPVKGDISDIAEEHNPKGSIVEETKRSSKRSHSLETEVLRSTPEKKICQLMYYNFAPLDNFQIPSKALKGWNTDDA